MNQLLCPRHAIPLEAHAAGSAELHQCPTCAGLWLRKEDLDNILGGRIEEWRLPLEPSEDSSEGHSPEDGTARCSCADSPLMKSVKRHGVIIDVCKGCGAVWLDGGELTRLLEHGRDQSGKPGPSESDWRGGVKGAAGEALLEVLVLFFDA